MTKLRLSPPSLRSACAVAQVIYDIINMIVNIKSERGLLWLTMR